MACWRANARIYDEIVMALLVKIVAIIHNLNHVPLVHSLVWNIVHTFDLMAMMKWNTQTNTTPISSNRNWFNCEHPDRALYTIDCNHELNMPQRHLINQLHLSPHMFNAYWQLCVVNEIGWWNILTIIFICCDVSMISVILCVINLYKGDQS